MIVIMTTIALIMTMIIISFHVILFFARATNILLEKYMPMKRINK